MKNRVAIILISMSAVLVSWFLLSTDNRPETTANTTSGHSNKLSDVTPPNNSEPSRALESTFGDVDLTRSLVDFDLVLSGGVARDGIPALTDPKFDSLNTETAPGETLGILIESGTEKRFYPYNILVSHEVVNDSIGELDFAVTFCPLCGSAIVFDRKVDGEVKEFGVSGFLYESNLIMYDRSENPSLWSQARGEAIIGEQAGTKLGLVDFQLLSLDDVRSLHPEAVVLSRDTGYSRSYDFDPYSGYEDRSDTIFPISVDDTRFPTKEVFFIVPTESQSVAVRVSRLDRGQRIESSQFGLAVEKTNDGELFVTDSVGEVKVGYYEMWFSWAQHHQDNGQVWDLSEI